MENQEIGRNIARLRKQHQLSQRELAEQAGITHSAISSIENGKVSPSVGSLKKIIDVFELSLSEFFTFGQQGDRSQVVISAQELVEIGNDSVSLKLVTNGSSERKMGLLLEEYSAHSSTGLVLIHHKGEEIGTVLEGEITLEYQGQRYLIKQGESYIIDTAEPHKFTNHTDKPCRLVSAHTPTTF